MKLKFMKKKTLTTLLEIVKLVVTALLGYLEGSEHVVSQIMDAM